MTQAELDFYTRVPKHLKDIAENTPKKEIDWEQRRYETAKELLKALISVYSTSAMAVKTAIKCADALIEELQKTKEK